VLLAVACAGWAGMSRPGLALCRFVQLASVLVSCHTGIVSDVVLDDVWPGPGSRVSPSQSELLPDTLEDSHGLPCDEGFG
jgi:hypothetical protein